MYDLHIPIFVLFFKVKFDTEKLQLKVLFSLREFIKNKYIYTP